MGTNFYRCYCKKCGHTVKTDDDTDRWMDPFFLPQRCPACGAFSGHHSRYGEGCFAISYGHYKRRPRVVPFSWLHPSTWASPGEDWVEYDDSWPVSEPSP